MSFLTRRLAVLAQRNAELEQALAARDREIAALRSEQAALSTELTEANATISDLLTSGAADIAASDNFVSLLSGQVETLQAEVDVVDGHVGEALAMVEERDCRIGELQLALLHNHAVNGQ